MIIDLKRIFVNENSSLPIEYSLDMSNVDFSGVYPLKKPVEIVGTVSNKASLVELDAHITYVFEAPCDRCGVDTEKTHTLHIQKSLAPSIEGEESDSILLVPDMKLDLNELVYSEVVVSLPMKHLCKDDCKGICVKCGKNLNEGKCNCPEKEIDPRLSALAELLNN
ncbi:MAG: YceD family protein [Acutalibacteraceae bacterium]